MKAWFVSSQGKVELRSTTKPAPKEGEVLVKMRCCGVCGTDLEKIRGEAVTSPVLGHEVAGEISELGQGVEGFALGDRVFTHHHTPCQSCAVCVRGEQTLCEEFPRHNLVPCGFSEYYVVPSWNVSRGAVFVLPGELSFESGSFIEPLACCIRALGKVKASRFHSSVIYGAGPVGLLHLKLLKHYGCGTVAVADPSEYRAKVAEKVGADLVFNPLEQEAKELKWKDDARPEFAIVSTPNKGAFLNAVATVAKGGTVLLFGAPPKNTMVNLDLANLFYRTVNIIPSYSATETETRSAADLLTDGSLEVSDLITHRFPLSEAAAAFAAAEEQKCVKALVFQ
jgi:L-iditol 2-dehydrogenase